MSESAVERNREDLEELADMDSSPLQKWAKRILENADKKGGSDK